MNQEIKQLLARNEGRYLGDADAATLRRYADGLFARLDVMARLEACESEIVEETIAAIERQFPTLSEENGMDAMRTARRDFAIFLRYSAASALIADANFIYDKLAVWYRTIILALVRPEAILFGFRRLVVTCRAKLDAGDVEVIVPYLEIAVREIELHAQKDAA
jgi:hypothetical protein